MVLYRFGTAIGVAVVAFGVVAVGVVQSLGSSGDVGPGIVGVGAGALVAIAAFVAVVLLLTELSGTPRWTLEALAVVGWTLLAFGAVVYVDVVPVATTTVLLVALVAGAIAFGARRRVHPTL